MVALWPQWPLLEYIALHKNVKNYFAVQHSLRFTVLQFEMRNIGEICRICNGDRHQKGRKNFRKPPFLPPPIGAPRHDGGVGALGGAPRGTRTGEIMLRIGTGARHGLRVGFLAVAAVWLTTNPTQAAPYADIVMDANSGTVLHSTNPDAMRHPASLTKIMTLYLLFEQLEAGELKRDRHTQRSTDPARQRPTPLGPQPRTPRQIR